MNKGGAKRKPVSDVDPEHLLDSLKNWARSNGATAFKFGNYDSLKKTSAISGPDLASLEPFLMMLMAVSDRLEFKYSDLKLAFGKVLNEIPDSKKFFVNIDHEHLCGDLANRVTTICTHARRLKEPKGLRIQEAANKCTTYQASALTRLRAALMQDAESNEELDNPLPSTQDLLSLQPPSSSEDSPGCDDDDGDDEECEDEGFHGGKKSKQDAASETDSHLLLEAMKTLPVPPRKQNVKGQMQNNKELMKRPASVLQAVLKRPAASMGKEYQNFTFSSSAFGSRKAEFYTNKSYIRRLDGSTGKWTLVIQVEGEGHQKKLNDLVSFAKQEGVTKAKLVEVRKDI